MTTRTLVVMTILAAVAVVAAALAVGGGGESTAANASRELFPDLDPNRVAAIEVRRGAESVRVERRDGRWVVPERGDYPARIDLVRDLVLDVAELEVIEPRTSRPEMHARLRVEDPDSEDARSVLVRLEDEAGEELAALVVGEVTFGRGGETVNVRRHGDDQAWLAKGDVSPQGDWRQWTDREIVRLPTTEVQHVTLASADGGTIELRKALPADTGFQVANLPEGRELRTPTIANSIGHALSYLALEDVRMAEELELDEAQRVSTAVYRTFDGLVVEVEAYDLDGETWAALDARHEPAAEQEVAGPPAPEDGADEEADPDVAADEEEPAAARARELSERVRGWVYRIPDYKGDELKKSMEDLLLEEEAADGDEPEPEEPVADEPDEEDPMADEAPLDEAPAEGPAGEETSGEETEPDEPEADEADDGRPEDGDSRR